MMEVKQQTESLHAAESLAALLDELSAITDYRALRDSLPRRLARLLRCRCALLYQRIGETLQLASGSFDDKPGWSASLLAVAHINPIDLHGDTLEASAWRTRRAVTSPPEHSQPSTIAVPLMYRQRGIGVLVAIRGGHTLDTQPLTFQSARNTLTTWSSDEVRTVEVVAGVAAMSLENTRLLERDRERIHELSLLNSISRQLHASLHDLEGVRRIVIQRAREISSADLCDCLLPPASSEASAWITPALQAMLLGRLQEQGATNPAPLVIERPGDASPGEYLDHLAQHIKTFFAIPLWSSRNGGRSTAPMSSIRLEGGSKLLGAVVGAYHRPWKLRREEMMLLSVLANQASSVLDNLTLMADLVEARNEARKLLRQVIDDQHEKRRLDRLASLGEMAANVAHEVRNPLASIKTSMQILLDDLASAASEARNSALSLFALDDGMRESVQVVLKEVERLDTIVRELLLFSRPSSLHRVACSIVEISERVLRLIDAQCAEIGVVVNRVYSDVPLVCVDMAQMEQVLINLFFNALQAMPDGGILTISCQAASPGWLEVSVSDTGVGIAPEQLERVFQPFFTTKAHGIGLGLPISRRLVEDHHGHLLVESPPGYGATFTIRLPLNERDGGEEAVLCEEEGLS